MPVPWVRKQKTFPHSESHSSSQDPLQQRTAWAISQLATRRYQASGRRARAEWPDSGSSCSSAPMCAICLEEFSEGQVRRACGSPRGGKQIEARVGVDRPRTDMGALAMSVSCVSCKRQRQGTSLRFGCFPGEEHHCLSRENLYAPDHNGTLDSLSHFSLMTVKMGLDLSFILIL